MPDAPPGHKLLDWMPWYSTHFWGSVRVLRLSEAACNLYRWMLDYQWVHGSVPDDAVVVSRLYPWGATALDSWREVRPLFDLVNGQLVNPKLATIHAEQTERVASGRDQRSYAGRRSAEARAQKYGSAAPVANARSTTVRTDDVNGRTSDRNGSDLNGTERNGSEQQKRAPRAAAEPPCAAVPAKRKRANPTGPDAEFREWWLAEFQAKTGRPYSWSFGKDSKLLSTMLKSVGLEETKSRASRLLHAPPEWLVEGGVDIGTLSSQFNKLAAMGALTPTNGVREAVIRAASQNTQDALPFLPTTPKRR